MKIEVLVHLTLNGDDTSLKVYAVMVRYRPWYWFWSDWQGVCIAGVASWPLAEAREIARHVTRGHFAILKYSGTLIVGVDMADNFTERML